MDVFKIVAFILLLIAKSSGQTLECDYMQDSFYGIYYCNMAIVNLDGFDGFTDIAGEHIPPFTDDDVTALNFGSSQTPNVPSIICKKFKNLNWMIISSSLDLTLTFVAFEHCLNMEILTVYNLIDIQPETFKNLHNLKELEISGTNFLMDFPVDFFSSLTNLERLDMQLNQFNPLLFKPLKLLKFLSLYIYSATTWHQEWFSDMNQLEEVYIFWQYFEEMPVNAFNSSALRSIELVRFDNLKVLDLASFGSLEKLETLKIKGLQYGNGLDAIDSRIFSEAFNLTYVDMYTNCGSTYRFLTYDLDSNRETYMTMLQSCFENFNNIIINLDTNGEPYQWRSAPLNGIKVQVTAANDAYIALSSSANENPPIVEIKFGISDNTRTNVVEDGTIYVDISTPGILNASGIKNFTIGWNNDAISVYREAEMFPFVVHYMQNSFRVNFYGLKTLNSIGSWRVERIN